MITWNAKDECWECHRPCKVVLALSNVPGWEHTVSQVKIPKGWAICGQHILCPKCAKIGYWNRR